MITVQHMTRGFRDNSHETILNKSMLSRFASVA